MSGIPQTPGALVAEVLMRRTDNPSPILFVEGPDDSRFWRPYKAGGCTLLHAGGKPALAKVMNQLHGVNVPGIAAIADEDCDALLKVPPPPNTATTDGRDLEAMLILGPGLDKVLAELGDPGRIEAVERVEGASVRELLLRRALPFGQLRLLSRCRDLEIPFDALKPARYVDETNWALRREELLQGACALGLAPHEAALEEALAALPAAPPHHLAQGHDLMTLLSIGLRQRLGSAKPSMVSPERVAGLLRAGTDRAFLSGTTTWKGLEVWESSNAPYRLVA